MATTARAAGRLTKASASEKENAMVAAISKPVKGRKASQKVKEEKPGSIAEVSELAQKLEEMRLDVSSKASLIEDQRKALEEKERILALKEEENEKLAQKLKRAQKEKAFVPEIDLDSILDSDDKVKTDSRKPKHPPSVFQLWSAAKRSEIYSENPGSSLTEVTKTLAELWKTVSDEEKKPFEEQHELEMADYAPLKKEYDEIVKKEKAETKLISKVQDDKKREIAMKLLEQYEKHIQEKKSSSPGKKKEKDPKKPKGALTPYFAFAGHRRTELKDSGSTLKFTEVAKLMGEEWGKMSSTEKAPFEEISRQDKARFDQEMEVYLREKEEEEMAMLAEKSLQRQQCLETALESKAKEEKEKRSLDKLKKLAAERKDEIKKSREEKKMAKDLKPKRPPNGFQLFSKDIRQAIKAADSKLTFKELCMAAAAKWKAVDEPTKREWNDMAAPAYAEYKKHMAEFKEAHPEASSGSDGASASGSPSKQEVDSEEVKSSLSLMR